MVLTDLVALCKKLAENPAITEEMRATARQSVEVYNLLAQCKPNTPLHFEAESLIDQIARFVPSVLEIKSYPEGEPNEETLV